MIGEPNDGSRARFESWEVREPDNIEVYCRDRLTGERMSWRKYGGFEKALWRWVERQTEKRQEKAA